jgi:hypothetical protein
MKHVHKLNCLVENTWGPATCPGIDYVSWVRLAGESPDQNHTWREHERLARGNYAADRELMPWYYDHGGEA